MAHGRKRNTPPPAGAGTVGTLLKVSAGAGLALVGAYGLSRLGKQRGMQERLARLEEMVEALSKRDGGDSEPQ